MRLSIGTPGSTIFEILLSNNLNDETRQIDIRHVQRNTGACSSSTQTGK